MDAGRSWFDSSTVVVRSHDVAQREVGGWSIERVPWNREAAARSVASDWCRREARSRSEAEVRRRRVPGRVERRNAVLANEVLTSVLIWFTTRL
jgi:hypothetical protein